SVDHGRLRSFPTRRSSDLKSIEVCEGSDATIIANGLLVAQAMLAADTLDAEGVSVRVIDMHTVKPLDRDAIGRAAAETGAIVVRSEEHTSELQSQSNLVCR